MERETERTVDTRKAVLTAVVLAGASTALVCFAIWVAPMEPTGDLALLDRLALRVAILLRTAWYLFLCPCLGLGAASLLLVPFGRRAPAGCAYAAVTGGAGVFALAVLLIASIFAAGR